MKLFSKHVPNNILTITFIMFLCVSCWMNETKYLNILVVPVCISMFFNLLFLCNIVRVVLLKLKPPGSTQGNGPSRTIVQAFR